MIYFNITKRDWLILGLEVVTADSFPYNKYVNIFCLVKLKTHFHETYLSKIFLLFQNIANSFVNTDVNSNLLSARSVIDAKSYKDAHGTTPHHSHPVW